MFYESVKWRGSELGMLYEYENDETTVTRSMEHFPLQIAHTGSDP